jgi:5S rRNA maturation endonuclease (ribonuclease M5)
MSNDQPDEQKALEDSNLVPKISTEKLLEVLDFEINRITAEQQRPGWTLWAIYGGLASSFWLLFDQWEKGTINVTGFLQLFIFFSMVLDNLNIFRLINNAPDYSWKNARLRFRFGHELHNRGEIFFRIVRAIFIGALAIKVSQDVSRLKVFLVVLNYFAESSFLIWLFVLTFISSAIKTEGGRVEDNKIPQLIGALAETGVYGVMLWAASGFLFAVLSRYPTGTSVTDFRVSGLLILIVFLIRMLLQESRRPPLLLSLIEIRRDVVFGRLDINNAVRQMDIALAGMPASEVFQKQVRSILNDIEECRTEVYLAFLNIRAARTIHRDNYVELSFEEVRCNPEKLQLLNESLKQTDDYLDFAGVHIKRAKVILTDLDKEDSKLRKRIKRMLMFHPEAKTSLEEINTNIRDTLHESRKQVVNVLEELDSVREEFQPYMTMIRSILKEVDKLSELHG